jgi:hypothetical protein
MPMTREQILQQEAACRVYQARADDALEPWGIRAPAPVLSDDPNYPEQYRRELAYMCKKRLPENVVMTGIRSDNPKAEVNTSALLHFQVKHIPLPVLEIVEPQIHAACKQAGTRNDSAPPGEMRMVTKVDPQNGRKFNEFLGTRSFIHDMKPLARRVVGFRLPDGLWNTAGRYVR